MQRLKIRQKKIMNKIPEEDPIETKEEISEPI